MMGDGAHEVTSPRRGRASATRRSGARFPRRGPGFRWPGFRPRGLAAITGAVLASSALAACASSDAATGGTVTLNYYSFQIGRAHV